MRLDAAAENTAKQMVGEVGLHSVRGRGYGTGFCCTKLEFVFRKPNFTFLKVMNDI